VKVRQVLRLLSDAGWYEVAQRGSHRQLKHDEHRGRVTVAGRPGDEIHPKTLRSILRQAGLEEDN
jgi:predicted RNA binding protein YcfA (HicA-like mRNA interferase family)